MTVQFLVAKLALQKIRSSTARENVELATAPSVHVLGWGTLLYSVSTANAYIHGTLNLRAASKK